MRLLKFEAEWCVPCKQLTKTLEGIEIPFPVERIDIDKNRDAVLEFGIRGVPHMILLDDDNNIVKRIGGALTKEQFKEAFDIQ